MLAHFSLCEHLGMGAFGSVWKAKDTELDRIVAIKIPRKGQLSPEESEKFLREARAAAQLKHPNIVSVHEVGRDGELIYIVSDFVEGLTQRGSAGNTRRYVKRPICVPRWQGLSTMRTRKGSFTAISNPVMS